MADFSVLNLLFVVAQFNVSRMLAVEFSLLRGHIHNGNCSCHLSRGFMYTHNLHSYKSPDRGNTNGHKRYLHLMVKEMERHIMKKWEGLSRVGV